MKGIKNVKQGFTLLELLVVVLIIGILASIALPQYKMAVTKAKVASMLPLMRRWKDALAEYKLQHGDYGNEDDGYPDGATLGVNWPSDWKQFDTNNPCGDNISCGNDYWNECDANPEVTGYVYCLHETSDGVLRIYMFQPDDPNYEDVAGMMICEANDDESNKVCKALGGKLLEDVELYGGSVYKLN